MGIYRKCFFLILLVFLPAISHAQVSKIVFTTEPQTVKPGEISATITIQLQDSAGNSYKSTETVDVEFSSSSVTGEFLSPSSENAVTKTISTGSANKNFRYRDSTEGVFTMTVKATGRTSSDIWSVSQAITISNSLPAPTTIPATTEETTTTVASSGQSSSNIVSAHYSATSLATLNRTTSLAVSAGRDRLGSVGSPLEFRAETNAEYARSNIFKWNFGDGNEGFGKVLSHSYQYPGEYIVVLNFSLPEGQAVARTNVKIIEPEIVVTLATPERVELKNSSKYEVSLFGRVLVVGEKVFAFPQDTIIKAGQSISFSANITGLRPSGLYAASILVIGESRGQANLMAKIAEQKLEKITHIRNQISILRRHVADISNKQNITDSKKVFVEPATDESVITESISEENESKTATAIEAIPEGNWFKKLKRFFLRTQ